MTTGSLDGLGRFVIELVAQVDDEQQRGYVGADDSFVPLARASTFASERAGPTRSSRPSSRTPIRSRGGAPRATSSSAATSGGSTGRTTATTWAAHVPRPSSSGPVASP